MTRLYKDNESARVQAIITKEPEDHRAWSYGKVGLVFDALLCRHHKERRNILWGREGWIFEDEGRILKYYDEGDRLLQ